MQELIEVINLKDESDIIRARTRAKNISDMLGFKYMDQTRIATAVSELARNAVNFAGKDAIPIFIYLYFVNILFRYYNDNHL